MISSYSFHYTIFPVDDDSTNVHEGGGIMSLLNNNKVRFLLHNNIIAKIRYWISFFSSFQN